MSSTESVPARRAPSSSCKKSGSKLKSEPAAAGSPASAPATSDDSPVVGQPGRSAGHKRRGEVPPTTEQSPVKRSRRGDPSSLSSPATSSAPAKFSIGTNSKNAARSSTKPKKSVSFDDTPTSKDDNSNSNSNDPASTAKNKNNSNKLSKKQQKQQQQQQQQQQQSQPSDVTPALEYLRQWKTSRESGWKFSKNLQSTLIRHIFESDVIPAADADIFYEYIRDLKGLVRSRLRQTAMEMRMQDAAAGTGGFPDDTMDLDSSQDIYDSILADVLRRKHEQRLHQQQQKQQQQTPPHHQTSPKRKYFNEAQYVSESEDTDAVLRRIVKRMRAEMVLDELSDGGEMTESSTSSTSSRTTSTVTAATTTNGGSSGSGGSSGNAKPVVVDGAATAAAGKRRRKLRVNMEDSSSSESDSDSDSDTSSSGSSSSDSDSEDDDGNAVQRPQAGYETSSSSSSSSSSGGETSDEDMDSNDEDEDDD